MDKFLKRKAPAADDDGPAAKKRQRVRPTFVIAPGASGGDCALLASALGTLGRTATIGNGGRWVGNFPSQMGANVALVEAAAARAAADGGGAPVVLVGHSFGCRVVAALLARAGALAALPAAVVTTGAILESYPLYGPTPPKPSTDRAAALRALPRGCRVLLLSGARDPFLDRTAKWRPAGAPTGAAALEAAVADADCDATVVAVDGAGHDALRASKTKAEAARRTCLAALRAHVDRLCPPPPS